MKITLGFSPCPNDTFMFDALVNGRIDTYGLEFDVVLADVEELNRMAMESELDVTKLSYYAFAFVADRYTVLPSGSALGFGCGPLLISKTPRSIGELRDVTIAVPGKTTTANFLLHHVMGPDIQVQPLRFSEIEDAVLRGDFPAGVIIHENRFTYAQKGLHCVADLGEYWEKKTRLPIPLGAIAVHRRIDPVVAHQIHLLVRRSVLHAMIHPDEPMPYVRRHAQELDDTVIRQHIDLYVNRFSIDLGADGEQAVVRLLTEAGAPLSDVFCRPIEKDIRP